MSAGQLLNTFDDIKTFMDSLVSGEYLLKSETNYSAPQGRNKLLNTAELNKLTSLPAISQEQVTQFTAAYDRGDWNTAIVSDHSVNDDSKLASASAVYNLRGMIDNINSLITSDDTSLDELQEIVDFIKNNKQLLENIGVSDVSGLQDVLNDKVDKVAGKGLSTNDLTNDLLAKINDAHSWGDPHAVFAKLDGSNMPFTGDVAATNLKVSDWGGWVGFHPDLAALHFDTLISEMKLYGSYTINMNSNNYLGRNFRIQNKDVDLYHIDIDNGQHNFTGDLRVASGKVAIGTSGSVAGSLTTSFSDANTSQATISPALHIANTNSTPDNYSVISFGQHAQHSNGMSKLGIQYNDRSGGSEDQEFFIGTLFGGQYRERFRISGDFTKFYGSATGVDNRRFTVNMTTSGLAQLYNYDEGSADFHSVEVGGTSTPGTGLQVDETGNAVTGGYLRSSSTTGFAIGSVDGLPRIERTADDFIFRGDGNSMGNVSANFLKMKAEGSSAAVPALQLASANTGLYKHESGGIGISHSGVASFFFDTDGLKSIIEGSGAFVSKTSATSVNPVFSFVEDQDTGLGRLADDRLSLIAGGNEVMRLNGGNPADVSVDIFGSLRLLDGKASINIIGSHSFWVANNGAFYLRNEAEFQPVRLQVKVSGSTETRLEANATGGQLFGDWTINDGDLKIMDQGSAASPALSIGNGGTGLYEVSDGAIGFTTNGSSRFYINSAGFNSSVGGAGALISRLGATATRPVFTFVGDQDTGIGSAGANHLSLIAGDAEVASFTNTDIVLKNDLQVTGESAFDADIKVSQSADGIVLEKGASKGRIQILGGSDELLRMGGATGIVNVQLGTAATPNALTYQDSNGFHLAAGMRITQTGSSDGIHLTGNASQTTHRPDITFAKKGPSGAAILPGSNMLGNLTWQAYDGSSDNTAWQIRPQADASGAANADSEFSIRQAGTEVFLLTQGRAEVFGNEVIHAGNIGTYTSSESDTLQSVTERGSTTTNDVTAANLIAQNQISVGDSGLLNSHADQKLIRLADKASLQVYEPVVGDDRVVLSRNLYYDTSYAPRHIAEDTVEAISLVRDRIQFRFGLTNPADTEVAQVTTPLELKPEEVVIRNELTVEDVATFSSNVTVNGTISGDGSITAKEGNSGGYRLASSSEAISLPSGFSIISADNAYYISALDDSMGLVPLYIGSGLNVFNGNTIAGNHFTVNQDLTVQGHAYLNGPLSVSGAISGNGSGLTNLNADTLNDQPAGNYARTDVAEQFGANVTFNSTADFQAQVDINGVNPTIRWNETDVTATSRIRMNGSALSVQVAADGSSFANNFHFQSGLNISDVNLQVQGTLSATGGNSTNWNTAYGWGNHASVGYLTSADVSGFVTESWVNAQNFAYEAGVIANFAAKAGSLIQDFSVNTLRLQNREGGDITSSGQFAYDTNDSDAPSILGNFNSTHPVGLYVHDGTDVRRIWTTDHFTGTHVANWQTAYGWGNHASGGYLTSADISGHATQAWVNSQGFATEAWVNAQSFSTSVAFADLTNKTSGSGNYSTSGYLIAGRSEGGVALTNNDGYGNANVTFNHVDGIAEQDGNAARIEVNTDTTTGAYMSFELSDGLTAGVATSLGERLRIETNLITAFQDLEVSGSGRSVTVSSPNDGGWGAWETGAFHSSIDDNSNASWILTADQEDAGDVKYGVQVLNTGREMRLYAGSDYLKLNASGVSFKGALLATQSWVNSQNFSGTDTLQDVTSRGASTTEELLTGGLKVIDNSNLGSVAGNSVTQIELGKETANSDRLIVSNTRVNNGADWTTAGYRLQQKVDSTWMGWIQFNGDSNNGGITFGAGLTTSGALSVPEVLRVNTAGITVTGITTASRFNTSSDDVFNNLGNATVGAWHGNSNYMMIQHKSLSSSNGNYALLQGADGSTFINAANGKTLTFRINNSNIMSMSTAGLSLTQGVFSGDGAGLTNVNAASLASSSSKPDGEDWDSTISHSKSVFRRSDDPNRTAANYPEVNGVKAYGYGIIQALNTDNGGASMQIYAPENASSASTAEQSVYFRTAWNDSWKPWDTFITHNNRQFHINKAYVDGLGINASNLNGLPAHSGTNNEANKLVRTDGNGYIQAGWINTSSGNAGTTAPTRIYASYDNYLRYYTLDNFRKLLLENNEWITSAEGKERIHFATNGETYHRTGAGYTWRNNANTNVTTLDASGNISTVGSIRSTKNSTNAPRYDTAFHVLQSQHWYSHGNNDTMFLGESGNTISSRGLFEMPRGDSKTILQSRNISATNLPVQFQVRHSGSSTVLDNLRGALYLDGTSAVILRYSGSNKLVTTSAGGTLTGTWNATTNLQVGGSNVWHAGNDGAGSGLRADVLESGSIGDLNTAWQDLGTSQSMGLQVFRYSGGASNKPVSTNNANWLMNIYSHTGSGGSYPYGHQIAAGDTEDLYVRKVSSGSFGNWRKLLHSGNYGTYVVPKSGGTFTGNITATNFIDSSDSRLKQELDEGVAGLELIKALEPKLYLKEGFTESGFYADQLPEEAQYMRHKIEGDYWGMDYKNLHAVQVTAIQEMDKEATQLKAEVKHLRQEVSELKTLINKLMEDAR